MALLSRFLARAHKLARYLEQPRLWRLRQSGVIVDDYLRLNQGWLQSLGLATVLDIGANVGQFCQMAHALWPRARIYSFEPLGDCYERLKARMAGCDEVVAFNVGLGEQRGELAFERNAFSASSSFLKMAELHRSNYPHTRQAHTVTVKIERLDELARGLELKEPMLVKIDVQGYEDRVLRGGEQTVRRAQVVLLETSFAPLYEGQILFDGIYALLGSWGFRYAGAVEQVLSPLDGRVLQADSLFVRGEWPRHPAPGTAA
jgi:FkbM family methyltransferase